MEYWNVMGGQEMNADVVLILMIRIIRFSTREIPTCYNHSICTVYRRHLVEVDDYFLSMKWIRMILWKHVQCWYFLLTLTWPIVSNLFSFCRQTARCAYPFRVAKGPPNYICLNPARVNKFAVLQIGFRRAKRSPKITLTRRRMTEGLKYHQVKNNLFPG